MTGNPVYLISTNAHGGCDRLEDDAYSSMAPDSTFAFVEGHSVSVKGIQGAFFF
jgi:hypothetical protein